jgi:AraC-like DNA-binding protein
VTADTLLRRGNLRPPANELERLLLLGVVEDVKQKLVRQSVRGDRRIGDIIRFVRAHSREPELSRATVARHYGVSESWMGHHFSKAVGVSFAQFLTDVRFEDGVALLGSTKASIKEIALTVGFSSPDTFPRLFRERFGQSPAQWRTSHVARRTSHVALIGLTRDSRTRRYRGGPRRVLRRAAAHVHAESLS